MLTLREQSEAFGRPHAFGNWEKCQLEVGESLDGVFYGLHDGVVFVGSEMLPSHRRLVDLLLDVSLGERIRVRCVERTVTEAGARRPVRYEVELLDG